MSARTGWIDRDTAYVTIRKPACLATDPLSGPLTKLVIGCPGCEALSDIYQLPKSLTTQVFFRPIGSLHTYLPQCASSH